MTILICLLVILVTSLTYALASLFSRRMIFAQEAASIAMYHDRISRYLNERLVNLGNVALLQLSKDIPVGGIGRMEKDADSFKALYQDAQILTRSYPDILSLYFYSEIDQKVFYYSTSSNGIMSFEDFYDIEAYYKHIEANVYTRLTPVRGVSPNYLGRSETTRETHSIFSLSIRIPFRERSGDVLVVNLNSSFFDALLATSNLPKGSTFLMAEQGKVIFSYPNSVKNSLSLEDYDKIIAQESDFGDTDLIKIDLADGEYHLFAVQEKNDRQFYLAVPSSAIGTAYTQLNYRAILLQLAIMVTGVALAILLAGTISRPLSRLLERARGERREEERARFYPLFAEIEQEIDEIVDRSKRQEETLDRYFKSYKQAGLRSLFRGDSLQEESLQSLRETFRNCETFWVLLLESESNTGVAVQLEQSLQGIAVTEAAALGEQRTAILVGCAEDSANDGEWLWERLNRLLDEAEGIGRTKIAIGPACDSMEGISLSYYGAAGILEQQQGEEKAVFLCDEVDFPAYARQPILKKLHAEVIQSLEAGQFDRTAAKMDAMFQGMAKARFSLSRQRKQCIYLLYEISLLPRWENAVQEEGLFGELQATANGRQLQNKMMERLRKALDADAAGNFSSLPEADAGRAGLIEQVQLYVREHYQEDISLNLIADYLYFTPQYLGKLYRDATGGAFTSYLVQVRMEAAAKLLIESRRSVAKIAEATGYSTVQSFGRVFKSYHGCTPGEYRRSHGFVKLAE